MPSLLSEKHEQTINTILHSMALWRCKEGADLSKIQIDFKQKSQLSDEEYKF